MIPKINNRGHSFKGVTAYLMHDKKANTAERVAWSDTGNMHTQDIEKAALVMAYIDKNAEGLKRDFGGSAAGRKSEVGNVYHYSLSWAHGENPDPQHQQEQALKTLERLGLQTHQYYMVGHDDTEHKHVHIVANLVNPETGKIHTPSFDKRELQAYALEYEREHIMHCHKREENAKKRAQGQQLKHQEQKQDYSEKITRAYYAADNGRAFIHALDEEGLTLAKARRGYNYVVVDEKGDIQKLSRQLDIEEKGKLKTAAIQNKLKDIDREKLKDADALAKEIKAGIAEKLKPYDREAQEVAQQKKLADAAEKAAQIKIQAQDKLEQTTRAEIKQKQEALQAKQLAAEKQRQAFEAREIERKRQWEIDQKTLESRQKWDVDGFIKKRDTAAAIFEQHSGLLARLTGKKQAAADQLAAQEKTLAERNERFKADILAYHANSPEHIQINALKKQGFNLEQPRVQKTQEAKVMPKIQTPNSSNDNMTQKISETDTPPESLLKAKKTKIFDSRREWELAAFEKSVAEQAAKMHQASVQPIEQKFNGLGDLRSPEELKKVIEAQQAGNENNLRGAFEDGLSQAHKETLQRYKADNPPQAEKKQVTQSQSRSQGHSIDHD